jgi:peptide/nickel transport system substrate-binding protein
VSFLRYAALLGMSATAAHAFVRKVTGEPFAAPAAAQTLPKGGTLRLGMRCQDLKSPHTYSWIESANVTRQVLDYLTVTGVDNVTRPGLIEKWEAEPRPQDVDAEGPANVKWHNGRQFTADDVCGTSSACSTPRRAPPSWASMKGFILDEFETGEKDDKGNAKKSTRLWDANAIQKVDDFTVKPQRQGGQLAIPEALFSYPLLIMDPPRTASSRWAPTAPAPSRWWRARSGRNRCSRRARSRTGAAGRTSTSCSSSTSATIRRRR